RASHITLGNAAPRRRQRRAGGDSPKLFPSPHLPRSREARPAASPTATLGEKSGLAGSRIWGFPTGSAMPLCPARSKPSACEGSSTMKEAAERSAPTAAAPHPADAVVERWWQDHFPGSAVARVTQSWNHAFAAKEELKRR